MVGVCMSCILSVLTLPLNIWPVKVPIIALLLGAEVQVIVVGI